MKKLLFILSFFATCNLFSQGPGMVISEVLANPGGTDSCREYVELRALASIDFSIKPFTVIVCNNGSATTQGWINGGAVTYAFEINSGTVAQGDVVYVGGSCMAPTGTKIRVINVKTTSGDGGIGTPNASGVFGNGGSNCDGVAVFDKPISAITDNTVPVDVIFFGTATGTSVLSGGTDGYILPVNDTYAGGFLQTTSYMAGDPSSDIIVTATGTYDLSTNTWSANRSWTTGSVISDGTSSVTLTGTSAATNIGFKFNDKTYLESSGIAKLWFTVNAYTAAGHSVDLNISSYSTLNIPADASVSSMTVNVPGHLFPGDSFPVNITLSADAMAESSEYLIFTLSNPVNTVTGGISQSTVYVTDAERVVPQGTNELNLNLLGSFSNGTSGSNSAEIVSYDPLSKRLYIANSVGSKVDIVNFMNPANPTLISSIDITPYGAINSVASKNGIVACAIENSINRQDSGYVVFLDSNGVFMKQLTVGIQPDMICFNHAGTKVYTANEGEPNTTYTNDPEGSVSVIDISGGITGLTNAHVNHITFTTFNGQETALRSMGIRIYGPGSSASQDFEPEYIAISNDDSKAYVTLQENNSIAEIDLLTNTVLSVNPLGLKDLSAFGNGLDASDNTSGVNIANFPAKGLYLPDALAYFTDGPSSYIITANEGDAREYSALTEGVRLSSGSYTLDPTAFPNGSQLKNSYVLGRLNVTNKSGDTDNDGDFDEIHVFGGRSFSIFNTAMGPVYDSGDEIELITANDPAYMNMFNASNGATITKKNRSDDKGPEPEGVYVGNFKGHRYAFIALERIGGVMVYNIDDPNNPYYVTYKNNRGPDLGAEGIIFIDAMDSPNGKGIVILANEVSSTLTIYELEGCVPSAATTIMADGPTAFCTGDSVMLSVASTSSATYQWMYNNNPVIGATDTSLTVSQAGGYYVVVNKATCAADSSLPSTVTVMTINTPSVMVNGATVFCAGDSVELYVTNDINLTYQWMNSGMAIAGETDTMLTVNQSGNYYLVVNNVNCTDSTVQTSVTVNTINTPTIVAGGALTFCQGDSVILYVANDISLSYQWMYNMMPIVGATDTSYIAMQAGDYNLVIDNTNCMDSTATTTVNVNVPSIPMVSNNAGLLSSTSAITYQWYLNGFPVSGATSQDYMPTQNGNYTVETLDANGCLATSSNYAYNEVGLNTEISGTNIIVAPNPYSNNTTITLNLNRSQNVKMAVYNQNGQLVTTLVDTELSYGRHLFEFGASKFGFASGVYFLKLICDNSVKTIKIVETN